jgi:histidinol-phosphate/aromatic aminotransferase/cobyric acid decarboxylase-like protein
VTIGYTVAAFTTILVVFLQPWAPQMIDLDVYRAGASAVLHGSDAYRVAGPAVGNFVFADLGEDAQPWFEAFLREGVIVRPLAAFGAPNAIRVTVGTHDEHEFLAAALGRVRTATAAS